MKVAEIQLLLSQIRRLRTSILNVSGCERLMRAQHFSKSRGACGILTLLLLIQILVPAIIDFETESELSDSISTNLVVSFSDGNSHEFAGDNLDYEGLIQATVRDEGSLDYWMESNLYPNQNNTEIGNPDIALNEDESVSMCWSESDGDIMYAHVSTDGNVSSWLVDTVTFQNGLVDCALMLTEHGKPRVVYADGPHLKSARYVVQDSIYTSDGWNIRTMREYINATHIEMVNVDDREWSVVRDVDGKLWRVNFTGIFWMDRILDRGPVGEDFELRSDSNSVVHIVYFRQDLNEVRSIKVDGQVVTNSVLSRGDTLSDVIGMSLDGDNVEQVATVNQLNGSFNIELLRSLEGQDTGRISPSEMDTYSLGDDIEETNFFAADFDGDGFTEVVASNPMADTSNNTSAGIVFITKTNSSGLTPNVIALEGSSDNAHYGKGLAVGDFNADGFDDLAIGSPGESRVEIYFGSQNGLSNVSNQILSGNSSDEFGSDLERLSDADGDGDDELAILSSNVTISLPGDDHTGQVSVYYGGPSLTFGRNITQTGFGPFFGRSIAGGGDLNGDGFGDLVITNTGTQSNALGYSSIEIFYSSGLGFNGTPDYTIQSNAQGRLLGGQAEIIGDINSDGYDDLFISELYNQTNPDAYNSGTVLMIEGGETLPTSQYWMKAGSTANERLGTNFMPAGDVNEDGYDDLLIMALEADSSGRVDLILGGPDGFRTDVQTIISGANSQEMLGMVIAPGFDIDGDGLTEIALSKRDTTQGSSFALTYQFHEKRDWDSIEFTEQGELLQLEVGIASRGETSLLYTSEVENQTILTHYEHIEDTTPTGKWVSYHPYEFQSNGNISYAVTSAGKPLILTTSNEDGINLVTANGYVALEQELVSSGSFGDFVGSTIDENGNQYVAIASSAAQQIYMFTRGVSSWNSELVISQTTLSENPSVMVADNGTIYITYRDTASNQLKVLYKSSSAWSIDDLGGSGHAVSDSSPSLILENGTISTALIESDGVNSTLSVWSFDHNQVNSSVITDMTDLQSDIDLAIDNNGTMFVSCLDSLGNLNVYHKNSSSINWTQTSLPRANGSIGSFQADIAVHNDVVIAVKGSSNEYPLHTFDETWTSHKAPTPSTNGVFNVVKDDNTIILFTSSSSDNLVWNSFDLRLNSWRSIEFGDLRAGNDVHPEIYNQSIFTTLFDPTDMDVDLLRFYHDADRDLVFDEIDDLPFLGNQWQDSDGDGAGDNPNGPYSDLCPSSPGPSTFYGIGCPDSDNDGFPDTIDDCPTESDLSYFDRLGCRDTDQDGWSSNRGSWYNGDFFDRNWKQVFDSDGDGYGDNSGPDCCVTSHSSQDDAVPDLFPYNPSQYRDTDGDGFGDNKSGLEGDECPWDYGVSFRDRRGCIDSDGDGSSDPEPNGFPFPWLVEDGADMWPNDSTQWSDSDGDGFGDNSSDGATNPDKFPTNIAAAVDDDNDGYPDAWTSNYSGNNSGGLELDGCPAVYGESTFNSVSFYVQELEMVISKVSNPGCPDEDGDGWSNAADDMPFESTQFWDYDGDGFGDNPAGVNPDACPYVVGVLNGTDGDGCPLIIADDEDGDGVYDSLDLCLGTPAGSSVDQDGCAESQLDDDNDGVTNDIDLCPESLAGIQVDSSGCTDQQNQADTDGDGVLDPVDICPQTEVNATVDANGCSVNQRDTDGDGVVDSSDLCSDTPDGYPVDSTGCLDESQLDQDLDGDGYFGNYTYELNSESGLRENQTGDAFPADSSQWNDTDGDGFGDNPYGSNSDYCPSESGNSTVDFIGCPDDDQDGHWNFKDAFPDEPTQWEDGDFDFVGDNPNGANPDLCLDTKQDNASLVDENGCAPYQRDTDDDGLNDFIDPCPLEPEEEDGPYGCPAEKQGDDGFELLGLNLATLLAAGGGALLGLVLLLIVIRRVFSGGYDLDDDDEDDDYYDDDDEDDFMSSFYSSTKPMPSRNTSSQDSRPPVRNSPKSPSGPPGRPNGSAGGPPKSSPQLRGPPGSPTRSKSPQKQPSKERQSSFIENRKPATSPPGRGPPGAVKAAESQPSKVAKKKSVKVAGKKVRKANIKVDMSVFDSGQDADRQLAVDWTIEAISQGEQERVILMQLQQTGWNAEQSRAIISIARNN